MYDLELERSAERDLSALPPQVFDRVIERIRQLGGDPRPPGCRKIAGSVNDWRIRVGDYRVIYEIDDPAQTVRVMRVRRRNLAYR